MSQSHVYPVSAEWADRAFIDAKKYKELYQRSISDPDGFWRDEGQRRIHWIKPFTKVKNTSFGPGEVSIKWFEDGETNVAINCIDRHLKTRGDQVAIIW
ncbi:MAG TPA: acetyl-coenzyme A synthetase N-terminal domain-containing protein, partial [Methylovirgula sp.]